MKAQNTIVWIMLAGLAAGPTAFAKSKAKKTSEQPATAASSNPTTTPSEKLDVTDLENKYWAPKDTDFSVVQNRTFTKEKKWFISAQFGPDITGGNYLAGNDVSLTGNYFFNERYGVQVNYMKSYLHPNAAVGDLASAGGYPNFGIMTGYYGLGFDWVPFYSKMSFLGKKILYFDMAITPTLGMTTYDQQKQSGNSSQSAFTYGFDVTQYYFFTTHFAFRVDFKNQWWNEKIVQQHTASGLPPEGTGLKTNLDHEMIFLMGFTYYFGF